MTDTTFNGTWALIMEGDNRGRTASVAFINEDAAAARPDVQPVGDGMINLDVFPTILIEGAAAWHGDRPDARGTCLVDGDTAVIQITDPSPIAAGWIKRLTLRRMDGGNPLSGTLHSLPPGDGGGDVANDDDARSELDFGFSDPCTLVRKEGLGDRYKEDL
jgi:hypothetical protein